MTRILSIQSDMLGHTIYCQTLRDYFATYPDIECDSYWQRHERGMASKVIHKLASTRLPGIGTDGSNRDLRRARAEWSYGRTAGALAKRLLHKKRYDLLHFHTQVQAFGSAELMKTIPTVLTIDMTAHQVAREMPERFAKTFDLNIRMERKAFEAAAHIVAFSDWARRSVIENHHVDPAKVTTVHPGVRSEAFSEPAFESRKKPRLLFVGGDFDRKGGWDLLEVFEQNFTEQAELHLVTHESFPSLPENVFAYQNVAAYSAEWHSLYESSDIFVLPSHKEAYGLVFQEAAFSGLALIGSRIGGIPEMVLEGENGILVTAGDRPQLESAIRLLVEDEIMRDRMRRRSHAIAVEHFDAAKNMRHLADVFTQISRTNK